MPEIRTPSGERIWVQYFDDGQTLKYIMTSKDPNRDYYILYEVKDGKLNKLGRSRSPYELEEKFGLNQWLQEE